MPTLRLPLHAATFTLLALAGAGALAEIPGQSEIYQQRGADGSIVLTDRPSPKAVTERTWQMQREDAGAAQRALDVRREAAAVSERVQRQIDAQQRRADADQMRMRLARADRADDTVDDNDVGYGGYGGVIVGGYGRRHRHQAGWQQQGFQHGGSRPAGGHAPGTGSRQGGGGFGPR